METLEARILKDGYVLGENILKVDSFLTHQVDLRLMKEIGEVFAAKFKNSGITKVVTIEASGIAPALYTADALEVPMIFAKKSKNITMNEGILTAEVFSFTKQVTNTISIASKSATLISRSPLKPRARIIKSSSKKCSESMILNSFRCFRQGKFEPKFAC